MGFIEIIPPSSLLPGGPILKQRSRKLRVTIKTLGPELSKSRSGTKSALQLLSFSLKCLFFFGAGELIITTPL